MKWRSGALVLSALALVIALGRPELGQTFPFWVINVAGYFADTMCHEMGHAIFAWAFGYPSIPAVFTLFGTDQAAGMALTFDRIWFVQVAVWLGMAYGVHWLWREGYEEWARIAAVIAAALFALSFWRHHVLVGLYMGHGSAILMGCFFLYRGLLDLAARSAYERWLNLFLGFFMLYRNAGFAWLLASDDDARAVYGDLKIFGASHHDFMAMHEELFALSVQGIAQATVALIALGVAVTLLLAYMRRYDYED